MKRLFLCILLIFALETTFGQTPLETKLNNDSVNITFRITNPYNRHKTVPGVMVIFEKDTLNCQSDYKITDQNGEVTLKFSKNMFSERLTFYYSNCFITKIHLTKFQILSDTVLKVQLNYYNKMYGLGVYPNGPPPSSNHFCYSLDSLNFDNCRYIDFSSLKLKRIPRKLKKYKDYIEILILDSTNIKKIPCYLTEKSHLRLISFNNTFISPPNNMPSFFHIQGHDILYRRVIYPYPCD